MTTLRQWAGLARKDMLILWRDRSGLAVLFLMPAMFVFLMTIALSGLYTPGGARPLAVVVVDQDGGAVGRAIVDGLGRTQGLQVETAWQGQPVDRALAEDLIVRGERRVAVIIPAGASASSEAIFQGRAPEPIRLEIVADPGLSPQVLGPLQGGLEGLGRQASIQTLAGPRGLEAFFGQLERTGATIPPSARDPFLAGAGGTQDPASGGSGGTPFQQVDVVTTSPAAFRQETLPNAVQQNVPGLALFGMFFVAQSLALSFLEERKSGTFRRLLAAPLPRWVLLLGKLAPFFLLSMLQFGFMVLVGMFLVPLAGQPGLSPGNHPEALVVLAAAAALAATGMGLLLAAIARTSDQVGGFGTVLILAMAAVGGSFIPRFLMPEFMQQAGLLTPHAWAIDGMQDVLVRGADIGGVLPEVAALLTFAAVFFAFALWRLRWT